MWPFFFMIISTSSAVDRRLASKHKTKTRVVSSGMIATLKTYPHVFNYLVQSGAIDGTIVDTMDKIETFAQLLNIPPSEYVDELVGKMLQRGDVYEENDSIKTLSKEWTSP